MKAGRWLTIIGFTMVATFSVFSADVKIIANGSVRTDSVSAAELKSVFLLQRKTLNDGSPVIPVLLRSGAIHESFLRLYLDRGTEELQTYYQGLIFTGKGSMPKQLNSGTEVIAYVAKTKGAIGYVSSTATTEGVKTLIVVSEQSKNERTLLVRLDPEYPETLRKRGIGGTVRLELTISPEGIVENVIILGGNPILGEAAAKAVKRWVYASHSSRTITRVTIPFEPHP